MIYVTITKSGLDWSNSVPISSNISEADYAALPNKAILSGTDFTLDLSDETSTGFSYAEVVGKSVSQIIGLFPVESDYDFKQVTLRSEGTGDFVLLGTNDAETIVGGSGNDVLDDGNLDGFSIGYSDSLYGGAGDDTYFVHSFDATVHEDASNGDDTLITNSGFQLQRGESIETMILIGTAEYAGGNDLANRLVGNDGANLLLGFEGSDTLVANGGGDILSGGLGNDRMSGGSGSDLFLFKGEAGRDFIFGFGNDDIIVSTVRIKDGNGDGIIDFGSDRDLDINKYASVTVADEAGRLITSLEYDGVITDSGVTYYVYSLRGSAVGVAEAAAHPLDLANAYDPAL